MSTHGITALPGDELRVDRGLYHHHGLYLGNGMVVQFGGRVKDKARASVHYVGYGEFAKDGRVQVVQHAGLDRAAAIDKALWLMKNPPPVTYDLMGFNCEHVARWCATGNIESGQAVAMLKLNSVGGVLMLLEHPNWIVGVVQLLIGLFLAWLSRFPTRQFERHIRENWPG